MDLGAALFRRVVSYCFVPCFIDPREITWAGARRPKARMDRFLVRSESSPQIAISPYETSEGIRTEDLSNRWTPAEGNIM